MHTLLLSLRCVLRKNIAGEFKERRAPQVECARAAAGLVNYIKAKRVFPIHTENHQLFKKTSSNVRMIEYGREYRLR